MNYKFVEKQSHIQEEMAYITYMMIGSYFHKCICKSQLLEQRLFMYYKEMKNKEQIAKEQTILCKTDAFLQEVKDALEHSNAEVSIHKDKANYFIFFNTGFETIYAKVDKKGELHLNFSYFKSAIA